MKTQTTISVIGGTGKSGQYLVQQLLQQGYSIRVLLRSPSDLHDPKMQVIKGDARDLAAIKELVRGADALISTLGQRGNDLPVFSAVTANVIQTSIQRYIVTTGLSVNTTNDQKSPWVLQATEWMYSHYPATTRDKQTEYELLQQSSLDWTLVRLPLIELTEEITGVTVSRTDCPSNKINAGDLANFLISQLHDHTFHKAAPFIGNL